MWLTLFALPFYLHKYTFNSRDIWWTSTGICQAVESLVKPLISISPFYHQFSSQFTRFYNWLNIWNTCWKHKLALLSHIVSFTHKCTCTHTHFFTRKGICSPQQERRDIMSLYNKAVIIAQLCLTLCDPMDYTVHGILQTRILDWVAVPFSRVSSQPRDWTQVSSLQVDSLAAEPPGKATNHNKINQFLLERICFYPIHHPGVADLVPVCILISDRLLWN